MLPADVQFPAGVALILVGLLACVAGYRLFRAVLTIYGFLLGAFLANLFVAPHGTTATLVALGVGGLLGAVALSLAYVAGVALVGGALGATLAHGAWVQWYHSEPGTLVVLLFAAIGAALAVTLQRVVVIVATAFLGAQTTVAGVLALMMHQAARKPGPGDDWVGQLATPAVNRQWTFFAWVALGLVGTFVQLRAGGKRARKK